MIFTKVIGVRRRPEESKDDPYIDEIKGTSTSTSTSTGTGTSSDPITSIMSRSDFVVVAAGRHLYMFMSRSLIFIRLKRLFPYVVNACATVDWFIVKYRPCSIIHSIFYIHTTHASH